MKRKKIAGALAASAAILISIFGYSFFADEDDNIATVLIGVHHLGPNFLIPEFYVNKYGGTGVQREGGGSGEICCVMLPRHWRPGLVVEVRWAVHDWSQLKATGIYIARVPVEQYGEAYSLYIHFFPNGRVRALTTPYAVESPHHPVQYGPSEGDVLATAGMPVREIFTSNERDYWGRGENKWK